MSTIRKQQPIDQNRIRSQQLQNERLAGLRQKNPVLTAKPVVVISDIFNTGISGISPQLTGQRTPGADQKDLAAIQARNNIYPDPGNNFEVVGNPFLTIPFSTQAEVAAALFEKQAGGTYDLSVPPNAIALGEDRLFQTTLRRTDKEEPAQTRAVLVDSSGQLKGAQCNTVEEMEKLFTSAPSLGNQVMVEAFGTDGFDDADRRLSLVGFTRTEDGSFTAAVSNGAQVKNVELNNFGVPKSSGQPALDVLRYHLDEFVASA